MNTKRTKKPNVFHRENGHHAEPVADSPHRKGARIRSGTHLGFCPLSQPANGDYFYVFQCSTIYLSAPMRAHIENETGKCWNTGTPPGLGESESLLADAPQRWISRGI